VSGEVSAETTHASPLPSRHAPVRCEDTRSGAGG
jgi:hypothetical protein